MSPSSTTYPPPDHLLRELRIVVERDATGVNASLEISREMLDGAGRVRVGVLATLVDVAAGETAIRAVLPGWIATSDLAVYAGDLPTRGTIEVKPRVIRKGRQTVVLEASFVDRDAKTEIALATLGFAKLPARSAIQKSDHWAEVAASRTEFARDESGLPAPLLERVGIEFDPARPGVARLAVQPYLINTLGAIQGGGIAILIESTADHFATASLGSPTRVRSLAIHYLRLARVGPIRAEARTVARTAGGLLVRVELYDEGLEREETGGRDDALVTLATLQVDGDAPLS